MELFELFLLYVVEEAESALKIYVENEKHTRPEAEQWDTVSYLINDP